VGFENPEEHHGAAAFLVTLMVGKIVSRPPPLITGMAVLNIIAARYAAGFEGRSSLEPPKSSLRGTSQALKAGNGRIINDELQKEKAHGDLRYSFEIKSAGIWGRH
jgi:hypothetical protein